MRDLPLICRYLEAIDVSSMDWVASADVASKFGQPNGLLVTTSAATDVSIQPELNTSPLTVKLAGGGLFHVSFTKITKSGTSANAQTGALYAIWYR